ncbi:hypothetical protein HYT25_02690 [Candidatus Pacearchaeota archaeon]|nr:hypothetical protein [Candidatus Pacearchaeota archaeon]
MVANPAGPVPKERRYVVHYMDGKTEELDPQRIISYDYLDGHINISGVGPSEDYMVSLVAKREPILVSKEKFSSKIERIINMENVRFVRISEEFPNKPYKTIGGN